MATQCELEELWRVKLAQAWARYENAKAKYQVPSNESQPVTPSPDSAHALSKASKEEAAAMREYMGVLRIITDFVVRGHMLPED